MGCLDGKDEIQTMKVSYRFIVCDFLFEYSGNDPEELGFYNEWNTIDGSWFAIFFSSDNGRTFYGFRVEWMCAMKIEDNQDDNSAIDQTGTAFIYF